MNENIIDADPPYDDEYEETYHWWDTLPPEMLTRLLMAAGVILLFAVFLMIVYFNTVKPYLIGLGIVLFLLMIYRLGGFRERRRLSYQEQEERLFLLQQQSVLPREALAAGHSITLKFANQVESYEFTSISPMTIPHGPMNVENYFGVEEEEPKQILAHVTSDHLDISRDFKPHADEILSGRITIFGISNSGKSNTFAIFAEELGRLEVPLLIGDTEDEYGQLADTRYLPHAETIDSTLVQVSNAEEFGRHILEDRIQAILNLNDYPDEQASQVLIALLYGMWKWEMERPNEKRIPCAFMLDEAAKWLPQKTVDSSLPEKLQKELKNCIEATVSRGRKRGLGVILANQRIAKLNKDVLQPNVQILHRQQQDVDIKRYASMGVDYDETASLVNGEAFIFTPHTFKLKTQVNRRRSPDAAKSPGLSALRGGKSFGSPPETFSDMPRNAETFSDDFETPVEPLENVSAFRQSSVSSREKEIPENIREGIASRYRKGELRTRIQAELELNDDQYWMVKAVCDGEDQQKRRSHNG